MRGPESSDFDEGGVKPPDFSTLENEQMEGDKPTRAERMAAAEAKCKEAYEEVKKQADEAGVEVEEYIQQFFDELTPDDEIGYDIKMQEVAENWEGSDSQKMTKAMAYQLSKGELKDYVIEMAGEDGPNPAERKFLEEIADLPCGPEGKYTTAEASAAVGCIKKGLGLFSSAASEPEFMDDIVEALDLTQLSGEEILDTFLGDPKNSVSAISEIFESDDERGAKVAEDVCKYAIKRLENVDGVPPEIAKSIVIDPERAAPLVRLLPQEKRATLGAALDDACTKAGSDDPRSEAELKYINYRLDGNSYSGNEEGEQSVFSLPGIRITAIARSIPKYEEAKQLFIEHPQLVEACIGDILGFGCDHLTKDIIDAAIPHGSEASDLIIGLSDQALRAKMLEVLKSAPEEAEEGALRKQCIKEVIKKRKERGFLYHSERIIANNLEDFYLAADGDEETQKDFLRISLLEGVNDPAAIDAIFNYSDEFVDALPDDNENVMVIRAIRKINGKQSKLLYRRALECIGFDVLDPEWKPEEEKDPRKRLEQINQYFSEDGIDFRKIAEDEMAIHMLFGTTGFTSEDIRELEKEAANLPAGLAALLEEYYSKDITGRKQQAFMSIVGRKNNEGKSILSLASQSDERRELSSFLSEKDAAAYRFAGMLPDGIDLNQYFKEVDQNFDEDGNMKTSFELKLIFSSWAELVDIDPVKQITKEGKVDKNNILHAIAIFAREEKLGWVNSTEGARDMKNYMLGDEGKAMALSAVRKLYVDMLKDPKGHHEDLAALATGIESLGGIGPLSQVEACLSFAEQLRKLGDEESKAYTALIERRFGEDRWGDSEKASFYTISADLLKKGPELYKEFSELYSGAQLDKREFKTFAKEIYPLYRAKSLLMSDSPEKAKEDLHRLLLPFSMKDSGEEAEESAIEITKRKILDEIKQLSIKRFGIREEIIPETLSEQDMRAIRQIMLYLGNTNEKGKERQPLFGLFLALQLGGEDKWKKFRSGKIDDIDKIIDVERSPMVAEAIEKSRANTPITSENTGIESPERLASFTESLQEEATTVSVGNIETVDKKLQAIIRGMEVLTDPDIYTDDLDKAKIGLLRKYKDEPKIIGQIAKMLWLQAKGKKNSDAHLSDHEKEISEEVAKDLLGFLEEHKLVEKKDGESDKDAVARAINDHLQRGMQSISRPFRILELADKSGANELMEELNEKIKPSPDIIQIFSKLGETFRPESGAIAIGEDIEYLRTLLSKNEDKLSEEEHALAEQYLDDLDESVGRMGKVYEGILSGYTKLKEKVGSDDEEATGVFAEVDRIVMGTNEKRVFSTKFTGDLMTVLENMRECLSAKEGGANNDTDLSFGEPYMFFMTSKESGSSAQSFADQIIHFVPIEDEEGGKRMSFVMDKLYGGRTPDVLVAHILTTYKKAKELKDQFPEAPITIAIPQETGLVDFSLDKIEDRLKEAGVDGIRRIEAKANEPESGFSDHYIEYGPDSPRRSGPRQFSGIEIVI